MRRGRLLALVGYGRWGANIARQLGAIAPNRWAYLVEPRHQSRAAALAMHPGITVATDLEAVLSDSRVAEWATAISVHLDKRSQQHHAFRAELRYVCPPKPVGVEPLGAELRHFLHSVDTGEPPETDGWEGVRVVAVLAAAETSWRTGKPKFPCRYHRRLLRIHGLERSTYHGFASARGHEHVARTG